MNILFIIIFNPLTFILIPLAVTYGIGKYMEARQFQSILAREEKYSHIITSNLKTLDVPGRQTDGHLVWGQICVGANYFKSTMTFLKKFVGGRLTFIEVILSHARREALLRLLEQADESGATHILNVRYETSKIGMGRKNKSFCAEIYAYGTAVRVVE